MDQDNARYRTLDTTNPKVMERLIGFEGVLDFLMLLGFESDAMGMKLICGQKPSPKVVHSAIKVLNSYQQRFRMTDDGSKAATGSKAAANGKEKGGADSDGVEEPLSPNVVSPGFGDDFEAVVDGQDVDGKKNDILTLEQIVIWATHESTQVIS